MTIQGDDVREGLNAVISVKVPDPQFEGQTKSKLGNSEVEGVVNSLVYEKLAAYFEEQPAEAKRIISKAIGAAEARETRKARDLARRKNALDSGGLPENFPTARRATRNFVSFIWSRAIPRAARQNRRAIGDIRRYSR